MDKLLHFVFLNNKLPHARARQFAKLKPNFLTAKTFSGYKLTLSPAYCMGATKDDQFAWIYIHDSDNGLSLGSSSDWHNRNGAKKNPLRLEIDREMREHIGLIVAIWGFSFYGETDIEEKLTNLRAVFIDEPEEGEIIGSIEWAA